MYATQTSQPHILGFISKQSLFKTIVFMIVVLCALYAYVIGNITFNVVARNTFTQEKNTISSKIGELEVEYLALTGNVTMEVAKASGFNEASNIHFVKKDSGVSSTAFLTNEL